MNIQFNEKSWGNVWNLVWLIYLFIERLTDWLFGILHHFQHYFSLIKAAGYLSHLLGFGMSVQVVNSPCLRFTSTVN